jgi:hypothetical protein
MQCDPSQIDASGTQASGVAPNTIVRRSDAWMEPGWYNTDVPAVDTAANETNLKNISVGIWTNIEAPKKPGGEYRAWSTTIWDPERNLIIKWAGGHVAHCGNDVPQYSPHTNRWQSSYWPEYPLDWNRDNNCRPGPLTFGNRPFMDVHTYDQYDYDINLHRMVMTSGRYTFIFNPDVADWEDRRIINPTDVWGNIRTGITYTPHGAFMLKGNTYTGNYVYLLNADSLRWDKLPATGDPLPTFYADQGGLVYDSKRDRIIMVQGRSSEIAGLWTFDFASNTVTKQSPGNSGIATGDDHYRECVYLPTLDKVFYQIRSGNNHLVYNCASNAWETMTVTVGSGVTESRLNDRGTGLIYDEGRNLVYCCDHNNNVFALRPDNYPGTAVSRDDKEPLKTLDLTVSPNPFKPSTTFRIAMPAPALARINVFDIKGTLVAAVLADRLKRGHHRVRWEAGNLGSGMYIVRLKTDKKLLIKRVLLLK